MERRGAKGARWVESGRSTARPGRRWRSSRTYPLPEAVAAVTKAAFAKFDETVEVAMRLGVDPKHADQMVRGTVVLPHGLGGQVASGSW